VVGWGEKQGEKEKDRERGTFRVSKEQTSFLESYYQRVSLSLFQLHICILETIADQFL